MRLMETAFLLSFPLPLSQHQSHAHFYFPPHHLFFVEMRRKVAMVWIPAHLLFFCRSWGPKAMERNL